MRGSTAGQAAMLLVTNTTFPVSPVWCRPWGGSHRWSTLEDRGWEARLTLFYKIATGEIVVSWEDITFEFADRQTRSTHKFKYKTKGTSSSNLIIFRHSQDYKGLKRPTNVCGGHRL